MIVKLIQCAVYVGKIGQFTEGQQSWRVLRTAPGLIAQVGGWENIDDNPLAVILGFWESIETYRHFMTDIHDAVFARTWQSGSYDHSRSSVNLYVAHAAAARRTLNHLHDWISFTINHKPVHDESAMDSEGQNSSADYSILAYPYNTVTPPSESAQYPLIIRWNHQSAPAKSSSNQETTIIIENNWSVVPE